MKIVMYLIFLVVLLIASVSFREGFQSGQYAYLAPSPPAVLDATTEANFIDALNKSGAVIFPNIKIDPSKPTIMTEFKKVATSDEFNYYIQNKKWPYNSYIMNYLNANKETLLKQLEQVKIYSLEDLQRCFTTRMVYATFINPKESTTSPKPLSNDIFTGKQPPPVETSASDAPTIHPPFSSENYSKLQSICSTLK
jgi:hypothetical protein